VMVQVLEGDSAIDKNRKIMGATNPADAEAGSIRADFADSIEENIVHGSDGVDTSRQEIEFFFGADGGCPRTRGTGSANYLGGAGNQSVRVAAGQAGNVFRRGFRV